MKKEIEPHMVKIQPKQSTLSSDVEATSAIDGLTVAATAVVAYLLATFTHEFFGHGLAALALGGHIKQVTNFELDWSISAIIPWGQRLIAAAGCLAQLLAAGLAYGLYRRMPSGATAWRYFLWLLAHINLFMAGGYLMTLSFAPFGDWNTFVQGLDPQVLWRLLLTVLGVVISCLALLSAAHSLAPFAGTGAASRGRALLLTVPPYLIGSAVNTLASIVNPVHPQLILMSAAASTFGGTAFLAWTGPMYSRIVLSAQPAKALPVGIVRNGFWLGLGMVALLIYFFVLGPGVPRS